MPENIWGMVLSTLLGVIITLTTVALRTLIGMRDNVRDLLTLTRSHTERLERHSRVIGIHSAKILMMGGGETRDPGSQRAGDSALIHEFPEG